MVDKVSVHNSIKIAANGKEVRKKQKEISLECNLTHLSHQIRKHDDINAELPANVKCAYGGVIINLKSGRFL